MNIYWYITQGSPGKSRVVELAERTKFTGPGLQIILQSEKQQYNVGMVKPDK